ncbi:MAG TPA: hypothetical protein VE646_00340 [Actinomycetota bacterium]|jgi:hypothetical protein|nr:hypothetical protein [Actinomycetota bacterium]
MKKQEAWFYGPRGEIRPSQVGHTRRSFCPRCGALLWPTEGSGDPAPLCLDEVLRSRPASGMQAA